MARTAVVLFNLGGPDRPEAVKPFLINLFSDPAILRVPGPVRWALARLIAARRAPVARAIYARIGGASPILAETRRQADALSAALGDGALRVFVAMRYWHPMADAVAREVAAWEPDRVVLLPLYPQYSTSTTGSFLSAWHEAAARAGLSAAESAVCCYPTAAGYVRALSGLTRPAIESARQHGPVRVLFSAHGVPQSFIAAGDPYRGQVEQTVAAVVTELGMEDLDHVICYQSRVGPLEWIRPYTDDEVRRGGADGKALVVVPVAFVSEHSETLVELDIEYAALARESGASAYERVPAVGAEPAFIDALAMLVRRAGAGAGATFAEAGGRICPPACSACPLSAG